MNRSSSRPTLHLSAALLCLFAFGASAFADDYVVDKEHSILAVVTHKAGLLSTFAHNHLVYASEYDAELAMEGADPQSVAFSLDFPVDKLVADDSTVNDEWYLRLKELGILEEPFEEVSVDNQEKIHDAMLSKKQLDAEEFPRITARLVSVRLREGDADERGPKYDATVEITIHGVTVKKTFTAWIMPSDDELQIDAYGPMNFTDFGIRPYRAALGAIRNQDEFDVFVSIHATKRMF